MDGSGQRSLNLPFAEESYSVSQLCDELKSCLRSVFPQVWVTGEMQRVKESRPGHLYFELVEKGDGDSVVAKLDSVIWRGQVGAARRALSGQGAKFSDGLGIRCRGRLDFYAPFGRLQFVVTEVDPYFTLGQLEKRRQETLEALAAAGLLETNRALPLPSVPLRVALVTSAESAAYHDFLSTLAESGYRFEVLMIHAAVQGQAAESEVASALVLAGSRPVDCIVLIRGGGSRTDLAAFDSRTVAEAVARAGRPVITGIGHEIDQSIADRVAHTAVKTPTRAAEFLVERVSAAEAEMEAVRTALIHRAEHRLQRAQQSVRTAERAIGVARFRLREAAVSVDRLAADAGRAAGRRLAVERRRADELRIRLREAAPRRLARRGREPAMAARRLVDLAGGTLREARAAIAGIDRLCAQIAPERTLARGFSLTRDATGRLVRTAAEVAPGDQIITELAEGRFASRVEET